MTKLESDSIVSLVREYFEGPFGLSFFMAWIYATFYSTLIWVGESQGIASEYPWIISMATSGLIGIVIHKICYEKFFESARYIPLICTIGMSMLIKNTVQILFGSETKAMPEVIPLGGIQIGNYRITYVQCTVMVVVTVLCILLSIFLNKTKQGVILRAVSQDRKAAAMVGIDVSGATLMGNVLGCGIGGVAGMLYALYYGSLSASMGGMATMKAFSSSVLGGLVDIQASAIGGLLIGISENYGIALFSSSLRDMIAFVFLIIVLIFFPKGLRIKIGRKAK